MSNENLSTQNCAKTSPGYQVMDNGLVLIHRKQPKPGLVRISRSNIARKLENAIFSTSEELLNPFGFGENDMPEEQKKKKNKKSKKKKKNKKNKKTKKLKKEKEKNVQRYSEQLDTSNRKPNNGMILSRILTNWLEVRVVKNQVYLYNDETGMFHLSDKQEITTKINWWLENEREDSFRFTSRDTDEAYKYLITNAAIQRESLDGSFNKPYVLCKNGVLELPSLRLLPFSPDYEFTSGINASYDENARGENFKRFINYATY